MALGIDFQSILEAMLTLKIEPKRSRRRIKMKSKKGCKKEAWYERRGVWLKGLGGPLETTKSLIQRVI